MKSSADSGSLIEQSARTRRGDRLVDDLARVGRVLLEELGELLVDGGRDEPAHPRVAELRLRLPLELRVLKLDGEAGSESLADVLALEVVVLLLEQALVPRVLV